MVLSAILVAVVASQVAYNPGFYQPSSCTPTVPDGCAGYLASSYSPGTAAGNGTGAFILAVIAVACAYYWGKSRGREESDS
jgi:hypothetical protein